RGIEQNQRRAEQFNQRGGEVGLVIGFAFFTPKTKKPTSQGGWQILPRLGVDKIRRWRVRCALLT
ncbi:hypothetical protein CGH67_30345, partial [Vibrio parahaemolyticus]|uniref:hypothetical protein n=1 Tax=Vibrio parahaemolyticus TaxID=670 RepID=UPI00116B3F67